MRWRMNYRGVLLLDEATEEEKLIIRISVEKFLSACQITPGQFRHPGLDQHLRRTLADLRHQAPETVVKLSFKAIKPLLRWCITDGQHLQDERRDLARQLWKVLFKGRFPDFVRWNAGTNSYEEDMNGYLEWCSVQVAPEAASVILP